MRRPTNTDRDEDMVATILVRGPEPLAGPIRGTGDDDVLNGTAGKDRILGLGGDDQLFGNAGRDVLIGGAGADHLDGGGGVDVADYAGTQAISIVFDASGTSTVHVAGDSDDTITAIERINGSEVGDTFDIAAAQPKSIYSGGGDDVFYADPLKFDSKEITIRAGAGTDTLDLSRDSAPPDYVPDELLRFGPLGVENVIGSRFADYIDAGSPGTIHGMDGDDVLRVLDSGDTFLLFGDSGDDYVIMYSRSGEAHGGAGDDVVELAFRGGGSPINSPPLVDGGEGIDTARYTFQFALYGYTHITFVLGRNGRDGTYTLDDGSTGVLRSIENIDHSLYQSPSNDGGVRAAIYGNEQANTLIGSGSPDIIAANGEVAPRSKGDITVDVMTGGTSADTFLITNVTAAHGRQIATDRITDFSQTDQDRIDLTQVDAKPGTEVMDHFTFVGTSAFSGNAGELRYTITDGITMVMADTDGDTVTDFALQLDGAITLKAADFVF